MYHNKYETKEIKFKPRMKLNHNIPVKKNSTNMVFYLSYLHTDFPRVR